MSTWFAYNGLDTRVSKTDSAGTTSDKRAGATVTDSLLKSAVSSTTTDDTPGVSSREGSDSTFLHSGIKNADTQTDDGGDVSAMRRYDAFGNPLAAWGGWQGPFGYGGPYGYQTDPDHGLMLLGHRYYEADTGRFLTRDPIKDGRNWYGYCGGSPLTNADVTGQIKRKLVKRVFTFLNDAGNRVVYHIYPSKRKAKRAAKSGSGRNRVVRRDEAHHGGANHLHDDTDVHITWESAADEATDPRWKNWRNRSRGEGMIPMVDTEMREDNLLRDIVEELDPTPIGLIREGVDLFVEHVVNPLVDRARAKRQRAFDNWISSD